MLRRERPGVRGRTSKEPDSFPSINPTSSSCIGSTGARLLRTLTPLGIIDIGKSAYSEQSLQSPQARSRYQSDQRAHNLPVARNAPKIGLVRF